jgi:hypothetical protein
VDELFSALSEQIGASEVGAKPGAMIIAKTGQLCCARLRPFAADIATDVLKRSHSGIKRDFVQQMRSQPGSA